ncbi:hypothetical protein B0H14DRAFT_2826770 [Mycena olivaceomarginata]|nr:hypothetical protein B0H14DRAFT_2826770 [Mycena olivaceomarginata]
MAHCPALWSVGAVPAHPLFPHCGADGGIMNARGCNGTSDVVSPRSAGKCGGAEWRKGAIALPIRICWGTMFPWRGKEVRCQREMAALTPPSVPETSGVACRARGWEWALGSATAGLRLRVSLSPSPAGTWVSNTGGGAGASTSADVDTAFSHALRTCRARGWEWALGSATAGLPLRVCPFPLPLPVHGCRMQAGVPARPPARTSTTTVSGGTR